MALRFSVNTKSGYGLHVGAEFSSTKCGKTLNQETLKRGNLCIAYMRLLPGLQKMNTKCEKTLNRDSTVC
jgi:hypothetical protein